MKAKVQQIFLIFSILAFFIMCTACGTKEDKIYCEEWGDVASRSEMAYMYMSNNSSNNTKTEEKMLDDFTALKNGNTKSLVNIQFGDKIDKNLYEVGGCIGQICEYRLKHSEDYNITYEFEGEGNGFSGFVVWLSYGSYFGINFGEDTIEKFIEVFGEPDFLGERNDMASSNMCAEWYFEKATLTIREDAGRIFMLTYRATNKSSANNNNKL